MEPETLWANSWEWMISKPFRFPTNGCWNPGVELQKMRFAREGVHHLWQRWKAFFEGSFFMGPIWGDQTMQMDRHFDGFPLNSALFGLVILLSYKDPCFSICSSHVCWKTFEIWKPSNSSELEIPENEHHSLRRSFFFFSIICHLNLQRRHFWRLGSKQRFPDLNQPFSRFSSIPCYMSSCQYPVFGTGDPQRGFCGGGVDDGFSSCGFLQKMVEIYVDSKQFHILPGGPNICFFDLGDGKMNPAM